MAGNLRIAQRLRLRGPSCDLPAGYNFLRPAKHPIPCFGSTRSSIRSNLSSGLTVDGQARMPEGQPHLRHVDWTPAPWEVKQEMDISIARDQVYGMTMVAILEELGVRDLSFYRQQAKNGKKIGSAVKIRVDKKYGITHQPFLPNPLTEDAFFTRLGGYNHIYVTELGPEEGWRNRHVLEKIGSLYKGEPTFRNETIIPTIPTSSLVRMSRD
ncbi:hypothetical protein IL306_001879 [Fusarium sp. DS 682]|nr:hypothetical protein IL306_001879 [Fusarium sp. DS 682]